MKKLIIVSFLALIPNHAMCDTPECQTTEVKVCFADGECICQVRQIEITDPVPSVNECEDQADSGLCS